MFAVILYIACCEFAGPINRQAQRFHLLTHVRDIRVCPILWVPANRHRGVLRRHTKRVPAHRVQNVVTCAHLIARDHVAHSVVAHVAHVDATRRVGEHLQNVIFRLGWIALCLEGIRKGPCLLPFRFDGGGVIALHSNVLFARLAPLKYC